MKREGPDVSDSSRQQGASAGPSARRRKPDWLLFFAKFLKHGKAIASFVPSSGYLSRAVVRGLDLSACRCVVELGAGTGPITKELLRLLPPDCRAVIIERDPDFCERLRERFPAASHPGVEVLQADAADLDALLAERGIGQVDHFLCGLPLPSFPGPLRDRVLEVVRRRLSPAGTFRQLTHMPWIFYQLYRRYFGQVQFKLVFRNLPPAGFYVCRGPKPPGEKAARRAGQSG
jgi:phospholipid N-methyltransferase